MLPLAKDIEKEIQKTMPSFKMVENIRQTNNIKYLSHPIKFRQIMILIIKKVTKDLVKRQPLKKINRKIMIIY